MSKLFLEESNLGLNQPKTQCLTQTRVWPIMKNIGHSSNCDVEIHMCLFAPSKPAPSFTLSKCLQYTFNI